MSQPLQLRDLACTAFSLGSHKTKQGNAARFTVRFGYLVAFMGLLCALFPVQLGPACYDVAVADDTKARGLVQIVGICLACVGCFYVCAGRANSEWFMTFTVFERLAATGLFLYVYSTGTISLQQVVSQACLDGGSAVYTCYLYLGEHKQSQHLHSR